MHPSSSGTTVPRNLLRFLVGALTLLSASIGLQRCAKETSYEGGPKPTLPPAEEVKSEWRFNEGSNHFSGPVDTAFLTKEGVYTMLTLTGKSAAGNGFIRIKIKTTDAAIQQGKTYHTSAYEISFLYREAADTLYRAIPLKGGDIAVTVTDVSDAKIIATFKGLVLDKADRSYFLTEGYFSSPVKKGPLSNNGYLMLWAEKGCNGPIQVKVNNTAGEIREFFDGAPECDVPGPAVYNLAPGSYKWVAYCGSDSLTGQATVQTGSCTKVLIDFPFVPAPVTNTAPQKTCRVSEVQFSSNLESDTRAAGNHVLAIYDGAGISHLEYNSAPAPFPISHPVTAAGDLVYLDEGNELEQYVRLDARKRVIEYRGLKNPNTLYPRDQTLVKYTYNDQDELIKREVYDPRYLYLKNEIDYTWKAGNIVSTTLLIASLPDYITTTEFEYYNKEVNAFPFVDFDAFEVVFYQPLFSFGRNCKNPPRQKRLTAMGSTATFAYDSYVVDNNGYVLSCRLTNPNGDKATQFMFGYHCY